MAKDASITIRMDRDVKEKSEKILKQLGLPMSTAIDLFLNQVILTGGIPFDITLPQAPTHLNWDQMTQEEFREKILHAYQDALLGQRTEASEFLAKLNELEV